MKLPEKGGQNEPPAHSWLFPDISTVRNAVVHLTLSIL